MLWRVGGVFVAEGIGNSGRTFGRSVGWEIPRGVGGMGDVWARCLRGGIYTRGSIDRR